MKELNKDKIIKNALNKQRKMNVYVVNNTTTIEDVDKLNKLNRRLREDVAK